MITDSVNELQEIDDMSLNAIKNSKDITRYKVVKDYLNLIVVDLKPYYDKYGFSDLVFKNLKSFDTNIIYSPISDAVILTESQEPFYLINTMSLTFTQKGVLVRHILSYLSDEITIAEFLDKSIKYLSTKYNKSLSTTYTKSTFLTDGDCYFKKNDNITRIDFKSEYKKFRNSDHYFYRKDISGYILKNFVTENLIKRIIRSLCVRRDDIIPSDFIETIFSNRNNSKFLNKTVLTQLFYKSMLSMDKKPTKLSLNGLNSWIYYSCGINTPVKKFISDDVSTLLKKVNELDDFNVFDADYNIVDLIQRVRSSKYSDLFFYKLLTSK